jgi:hypothetical protein
LLPAYLQHVDERALPGNLQKSKRFWTLPFTISVVPVTATPTPSFLLLLSLILKLLNCFHQPSVKAEVRLQVNIALSMNHIILTLEKLTLDRLMNTFPTSMELKALSSCSQEPSTLSYYKPYASIPHIHTLFFHTWVWFKVYRPNGPPISR